MRTIQVEHNPNESRLSGLGARSWPIWTCDVSEFPWTYDSKETCYILEGEVIITPDNGRAVTIQPGDVVVFPAGMLRRWNILKPIKKHYLFE